MRGEPILRMTGRGRTLVLTFDDGPHPEYTPEILDTLAKYEVRATFFVCGEMADYNGDLLTRMADEGHTVGNHTWSHPLLTSSAPAPHPLRDGAHQRGRRAGLRRAAPLVPGPVRCLEPRRLPAGRANSAWSRSPGASTPWTGRPGTGTIVDRVEEGAAPGVVVLSHDAGGNRSQSVRALRRYLPELLDSGYHLTVPPAAPDLTTAAPAGPGHAQRTSTRRAKATTFPS
ncbi:Polysaccharide deacetylase family protein OS=Streptomyces tendae OX=1932 GN=GUR47_03805 PE=4 SV=1 [Streptomyces tendae]